MCPFFSKIVHYHVDKTESLSTLDTSYFLKSAVLSQILSTRRLSATALVLTQVLLKTGAKAKRAKTSAHIKGGSKRGLN